MAHEKQYGLILPGQKQNPPVAAKPKNIFGDDSSEEEGNNVDWVKQSLKKQSHGSMQQKQSMKVLKKAVEDDPSVFEYDAVYDDMTRAKEEEKAKEKSDKKPKYIAGLLKTAKARELENELRKERLAQKERETEGDKFADKEAFVTGAYKKKMEELRQMQEDQAHEDAVDDLTEVTKQKDMSGFYRYLYKAKVKDEPVEKSSGIEKEKNDKKTEDIPDAAGGDTKKSEQSSVRERSPRRRSSERHPDASPHGGDSKISEQSSVRDRSPRRHSSDRHHGPSHHKRSRHDSDERRRSSRRRDDDYESRSHGKSRYHDHRSRKDDKTKSNSRRENVPGSSKPAARDTKLKITQNENWYDFDVEIERDVNKNFYAKRTVGKAFDEALQRYLLRKGPDQVLDANGKFK